MRREAFKFWVLVRLILETLRYFYWSITRNILEMDFLDIEPHRSVWRIWMFRHQMVANPSANNHGDWFVEREECWKTHEFFSLAVGLYQSSSWILPMMGSHDNYKNIMTATAFFRVCLIEKMRGGRDCQIGSHYQLLIFLIRLTFSQWDLNLNFLSASQHYSYSKRIDSTQVGDPLYLRSI